MPVQVFSNGGKTNQIYNRADYGPTFGGNHDLHVADNSNANNGSYINIGNSYILPPQAAGQPHFFNGGTRNFQVQEIEVYAGTISSSQL